MLRDIAGIRLCGANFDEVTNILLLDPHEGNKVKPVKGTLLYGRNGAGKSTLAKAVRKAKGESQDTISQAEFLSINNLPIELTEEEKSHVFVFDEEYIDKNVKFHESGLDTIIMLGHQVEIAEQLQEAQKNLEKAKGEFDIQEKTIIENEKIECKNSPKYHIKKMRLAVFDISESGREIGEKLILLLDERQRKELAQYSPYIAIPKVSSQNRRYIPMDYLEGEIIPGDKLFTMPSATSYEFGILMSNVHMAWTRAVCGRLKSDYSYSNMIVYNNFPWPSPTNDQKEKIRKTAQAILNARALYTDSNLADLYDPLTMPTELLKAHKANNRAVMHAYGFSIKMSEADCVAELMRMYQKLTKEK